MKNLLLIIAVTLSMVSCTKEYRSHFRCICDIYGIKTISYSPQSKYAKYEEYADVKQEEATGNCDQMEVKFNETNKDTIASLKVNNPTVSSDCSLDDLSDR